MSLTVSSLSKGSIGPSPVISWTMSSTNWTSSCALSTMRSLATCWATRSWICARNSFSGIFSTAARLISSMSRRWILSLAASSRRFWVWASDSGAGRLASFAFGLFESKGDAGALGAGSCAGLRSEKRPSAMFNELLRC
jgi:hypothetical protein